MLSPDPSPEARLALAVLKDAVGVFMGAPEVSGRRAWRELREVEGWLASDDTAWPLSFVNVAALLGLDPDYVRVRLRRLRAERWLGGGAGPAARPGAVRYWRRVRRR
jgi:hypothetical protein